MLSEKGLHFSHTPRGNTQVDKSRHNILIRIRPFRPEYQKTTRALILDGLAEHWGTLDPRQNPDLDDIASTYAQGLFLIAWAGDEIVGTGAFLPRSAEAVEIVRMSVRRDLRRQGIGRRILAELCAEAARRGYRQVVLETTQTWEGAIAFYTAIGFRVTHYANGNVYFRREVGNAK